MENQIEIETTPDQPAESQKGNRFRSRPARVGIALVGLVTAGLVGDRVLLNFSDGYRMQAARSAVNGVDVRGASVVDQSESSPVNYWDITDEKGSVSNQLEFKGPTSARSSADAIDSAAASWTIDSTSCDRDGAIRIDGH